MYSSSLFVKEKKKVLRIISIENGVVVQSEKERCMERKKRAIAAPYHIKDAIFYFPYISRQYNSKKNTFCVWDSDTSCKVQAASGCLMLLSLPSVWVHPSVCPLLVIANQICMTLPS